MVFYQHKRMPQPVKQEDDFGCAVACLTYLFKKSYRSLVQELGIQKAKK